MSINKLNYTINELGVHVPTILLPHPDIDYTRWAVIACDQYTSEPEYWKDVEKYVDGRPSTLNLVFPELYLENDDSSKRIENINNAMLEYLDNKVLVPLKPGFLLVDRKTSHKSSRKGLVMAIDLEKYDYNKGSQSLVRATEGTVLDRLPPRIRIRQNAAIELPHIMLLIDDPEHTVIEPLSQISSSMKKVYDFDLMMGGGHIKGYMVDNEEMISSVMNALEKLAEPEAFRSKYSVSEDRNVLLFAAGDGNHSLATAKACWESIKKDLSPDEAANHPARFALVEVVNVHDEGLEFHPIHRVVFNINPESFLDSMTAFFNNRGLKAYCIESSDICAGEGDCTLLPDNSHVIPFVMGNKRGSLVVENPEYNLEVGTLQSFLDELLKIDKNVKADYIHGEDVVCRLGSKQGNAGFLLPSMDKKDLFKTVILEGALPRKTFSMGEAEEKRYYLECRKIVK